MVHSFVIIFYLAFSQPLTLFFKYVEEALSLAIGASPLSSLVPRVFRSSVYCYDYTELLAVKDINY